MYRFLLASCRGRRIHSLSWNFFKISFRASSLGRSVGRSPVGALAVVLRRGENHTGRPLLQPLRRRVVLIAHFKVGCGGERVSHASARTRTGCTTSLLPHSLPLLRSAWTERESERAGQARVGRTILRSAEFFFLHSLPRFLPPSLAQSFLWHRITSGTCACVVAPAAAVLLLLRSFSPSLCLCLSPLSSAPSSSHGFLQSLRSPSSPFLRCSSLTHSVHDEIRSARNIADSSQNATITPFSAVTEEGAAPTTKDRAE